MRYVIKRGDTLSELAVRFNTTTASLARANDISDPDKIYEGHILEVPGIDPWAFDLWAALKRFIWGP